METIMPVFKNEEDKTIVILTLVLAIFLGFLAPLIVMLFFKEKLSENSFSIVKTLLNFELMLLLFCIIFMIPIVGWLIATIGAPVVAIINLIFPIMALVAVINQQAVKFPVLFKFVK